MGINVNFYDELIYITNPTDTVTIQQLVDIIRAAENSIIGMNFDKIIDAAGKEDLGGGVSVGITLNLLGDWQVKFWQGNYTGVIKGGNLVGGKDGDPIAYTAGVQVVLLQSASATITGGNGGASVSEIVDGIFEKTGIVDDDSIKFSDVIKSIYSVARDRMNRIIKKL